MIAFAATVYVARVLGVEAYGVLELAAGVTLYFSRVADAGFDLGLGVREVAHRRRGLSEFVSAALTFRTTVSLALAGLVSVISLAALPYPEGPVIAAYGVTLVAVGLGTRWVHIGLERTRLAGVAKALGELVWLLLVVAIVRQQADLLKLPWLKLAGDGVAAVVLLTGLFRRGVRVLPRLDLREIRPLLRRAVPLVLSALFGLLIYNADLIFLRVFFSRTEVGLYAAAYVLISFLVNMTSAYSLSLLPTLTRLKPRTDDRDRLYQDAHAQSMCVALPVAVGGALVAGPVILLVFGAEFSGAAPALAILVWSIPVGLLRDLANVALISEGDERRILRLTIVSATFNLAGNLVFVPLFGILGAAVTTTATEVLRWVLTAHAARRHGFRTPRWSRHWKTAVSAAAMGVAVWALRDTPVLVSVAAGAAVYTAGLVSTRALHWRGGIRLDV